jgi:DUF4097 and DUF4098 domain-containing protein YvlB
MTCQPSFARSAAAALFFGALLTTFGAADRAGANPRAAAQHGREDGEAYDERDESRQKFTLAAGARVEVTHIRGPVEVETANVSEAEVHIVRTARSRDDLKYHRVEVAQTREGLVVRGVQEGEPHNNVRVRHHVKLRLPRRVDVIVQSINGRTQIGEVEGSVQVRSVNGGLRVGRAVGYADIAHVNGGVAVTLARLEAKGVSLRHINGGIELRFADEVNADLEVSRTNGGVTADLSNATLRVADEAQRDVFRRRIGAGGMPITIAHVNGGVRLMRF